MMELDSENLSVWCIWLYVLLMLRFHLQTKWFWLHLNFVPASSKEFLDIQVSIECGFTLKRVRDMARTYSQMHRTDKYSEHRSIIWPVSLNGWVFAYELSGSGFESSCNHLHSSPFGTLSTSDVKGYVVHSAA